MSLAGQYTILCLLWNNSDGHDKVWGYFRLSSDLKTYYNFWGARGKKLTWKEYKGAAAHSTAELIKLEKLESSKLRKGYHYVDIRRIESTTPGFIDEFERTFTLARLFDNFHNKVHEDDV